MNDPLLGELKPDPHLSDCLVGAVPWDGRVIEVRLDHRGQDLKPCLALAREALESLLTLEVRSREVAVDHLLGEYNESWRTFARSRADGSMEEVEMPVLTNESFAARLQLQGLVVSAPCIEFRFDDSGLFAGHTVFVTSFDGVAFSEARATLFG